MEQEPQQQAQPEQPQPETTPAIPQTDGESAEWAQVSAYLKEAWKEGQQKMEAEGCACNKPNCAAKAFHRLEHLSPDAKADWDIVKKQLEQQIDAVMKEHSKTRKLTAELQEKLEAEHEAAVAWRALLVEANRTNYKLSKTLTRVSKK